MKILLSFFLLTFCLFASAQTHKNAKTYIVNYSQYNNNKLSDSKVSFKYTNGVSSLSKPESKIRHFTDYNQSQNISIIKYDNKLYKTITPLDSLPKPTFGNKEEDIQGYKCKYASYMYFSNRIEVWYTEDAKLKGSPYRNYLPTKDALVLKITINGNNSLIASSIEKLKSNKSISYPFDLAENVSKSEFEGLKIKSRYTILNVFNNETINFVDSLKAPDQDKLKNNITYHFSKGTVVMKKISIPSNINKGDMVFAKLTSWSNGDAYDRTGSIFLIPSSNNKNSMLNALLKGLNQVPVYTDNKENEYQGIISDSTYNTPIELMRFFTSFGVRQFNDLRPIHGYPWQDSVIYKQDVTQVFPLDQKEVWIGVFIGNYDKGGHKLSLDINFYPSFEKEKHIEKLIQPLFYTVNIMEVSGQNYGKLFSNDTLRLEFEVAENVQNLQLIYTSTGHGGWGGGDEFNPKLNQLFIDGKAIYSVVPWRTDCASYRFSNPASGNFSNGLSSSDLSRSNWCPATITPPYLIPLSNIKKGKHTLEVVIDQGENEGNSFSSWNVSATLIGELEAKNNYTPKDINK